MELTSRQYKDIQAAIDEANHKLENLWRGPGEPQFVVSYIELKELNYNEKLDMMISGETHKVYALF